MKISGLAEATGVSVATLKFYLREKLLHAGVARSRTQADYDESHVERVRLVRALSDPGGLDLATIRRILEAIEAPELDRLGVLGAAQRSLLGADFVQIPPDCEEDHPSSRARDWLEARGWMLDRRDPVIDELDRAWAACDVAGIGLDEARMDRYAAAMEQVAAADVDSVPSDPTAALRQVVLGTVLVDPVLVALRRLAQQHVSVSRHPPPAGDDSSGQASGQASGQVVVDDDRRVVGEPRGR